MMSPNELVTEVKAVMSDRIWMLEALKLAEIRKGMTHPNPAVGAVVVLQNQVIASGHHVAAGSPHAEVEALGSLSACGQATLYVTLEPCCHYGLTPPCTQLIIAKGIGRVVFSLYDPNPQVSGQGQQMLLADGIDCLYLPLPEVHSFYEDYVFWRRQQRSWLTAKLAMTANRMIAHENGSPMSITGVEMNRFTHLSRKSHSALLTSVNTVITDNPSFNVRLDGNTIKKTVFVLDQDLRFPQTAQLVSTAGELILLHACSEDSRVQSYEREGMQCWYVGAGGDGLDLASVLKATALKGYHSLWLECGGRLLSTFLAEKRLQRFCLAVSNQTAEVGLPLVFKSIVTTPTAFFSQVADYGLDTLFVLDFVESAKSVPA